MKIELRNLKIARSLSEETVAYTATICVDGIPTFDASNHGQGGCDFYRPLKSAKVTEAEVDAWLKANRPPFEAYGMTLEPSLEMEVGDIIAKVEREADLKRIRKSFDRILTKSIAALKGDALVTFKAAPTPANLASLRKAKPELVIVNDADAATLRRALFAYCPDLKDAA